jgi:hypothetical protein
MYDILKNLILIDLSNIKPENIEKLLIDNGLNDELCHEKLAKMKDKGVDKLYLDSKTFETVAAVYSDNPLRVMWEITFLVEVLDMKPIKFKSQKLKPNNAGFNKLDIDAILDKINENGIDSLTEEEKRYLKNNN